MLALALGAWWLGYTPGGLRWALERATQATQGRLEVDGAQGTLARNVEMQRIAWESEGLRIEAREVSAKLALLPLLAGMIRFDSLRAHRVLVAMEEQSGSSPPPERLALPWSVRLERVEIGELAVEHGKDRQVFSQLAFGYAGGPTGHELRRLAALTPWGQVSLDASMAASPPFATSIAGTLERREGKASVRARLLPFGERKIESLQASAANIDLARIDPALPHTSLQLQLEGASAPDALLAGKLSAANAQPGPLDQQRLPLRSASAGFALKGETLTLSGLQAQAAGGSARGSGVVETTRAELTLQLSGINLKAIQSSLRETQLAGRLRLSLDPRQQAVQGALEQDGMRLAADLVRTGALVEIRALRAEAGGGVATGRGRVNLGKEVDAEGTLQFSGFDPSKFGDYPQGSLNGSAVLAGRLGQPRRIEGRWTIAGSMLLGKPLESGGRGELVGDPRGPQRLRSVDGRARWGSNTLSVRGAFGAKGDELGWTLQAPELPFDGFSGTIEAEGTASGTWETPRLAFVAKAGPAVIAQRFRARVITANVRGTLAEHVIAAAAVGEGFELAAELAGGWSKKGGWQGEVRELRNSGRYPLQLAAPVPLHVAPEAIHAGTLRASLGEGRLVLQSLDWSPGRLATHGEFSGLPASWVLVSAGLGERLSSTLRLDGKWNLESTPLLTGQVSLARASGDLSLTQPTKLPLGLREATLAAHFEQGRVTASAKVDSELGALQAEGNAAGFSRDSALRFGASLDLKDIRVLAGTSLPAQVRLAGKATARLEGRGTLGEPELAGDLRADGLSLHMPPYGIYLDNGILRATLEGEALRVDELTLHGGEGRLTATGRLPLKGAQAGATLRWTAQRLQALSRPDMRLVVSGEGAVGLDDRRLALQGKLIVDNGLVERGFERLPKLGDDIVVVGQERARPADIKTAAPVDLDLLIDLGESFRVREAGFDGLLRGQVNVSAVAGQPLRAYGRIEAVRATFRAYGRDLTVDPGVVVFNGPIDNPVLQITAWRRNPGGVDAGVRITGNLDQPRVELVSEPPLGESEKLSWLVLGRAPSEAGGADLALLQTAATALLGRRGGSDPITTRLANAVGLDEVSLGTRAPSSGPSEVATRVVTFGKRLSDRIYLSYEQGLGATAQNLVKIDLSLTSRLSLRAQTGTISGVGVYYRYAWD